MDLTELIFVATSQDRFFHEDRKNLALLGYRNCARFSSGQAAVEFVRHNPVRIVLVDTEVEGLGLAEFVSQLRGAKPSEFLHILVISPERAEDFVLSVISAGCSGLVLRPYLLPSLEKYMLALGALEADRGNALDTVDHAASLVGQGRYEEAIGDLSQVLAREDKAQEFFFQGCQFLVEKKWSEAIRAFSQSLAHNQAFIKAYEGLAKAYLGKRDLDRYRYYLQKAAEEYARLNNFAKVKKIFVEIVKYDVNAPNPYNTLGIRLRQEKQYKEAIDAYFRAIELSPKDENIHYNMAKAYYCDEQPQKSLECIKFCLALSPGHAEALRMHQLLTGVSWEEDPRAELSPRYQNGT